MLKFFQKHFQNFILYFIPKRIVYTINNGTGLLYKATEIKGTKYLTIADTKGGDNNAIVYHVPIKEVIGIKHAITPFQRWWYGKVICKPLPKYKLKKLKK